MFAKRPRTHSLSFVACLGWKASARRCHSHGKDCAPLLRHTNTDKYSFIEWLHSGQVRPRQLMQVSNVLTNFMIT